MLFATIEVATKLSGTSFNSIQLTFLRFFIGGVVLLPFALIDLKKRQLRLSAADLGYLLFIGTVCVGSMVFMQVSLLGINANLVAIILSANPLFTMIFAHFVANDPFTRRKALVLALMLTGLIITANPKSLLEGSIAPFYMFCAIMASVTFGFYTAYGKRRVGRIGGIGQNALSFLLGCSMLLIVMLIADIPVIEGINTQSAPLLLYLGVFATGLGYYFYLKAIDIGGPSMASIAFFLKPMIAPIIAFAVLREPITPNLVIGLLFILAGSYINISHGLKKKA